MPTPAPLLDPMTHPTLSIDETAMVLGISRGTAYELARRGDIPVIRLGPRRLRVPTARLMHDVLGIDVITPPASNERRELV